MPKTHSEIQLVDFDPNHFLTVCRKHDMTFKDVAAYLSRSEHALQIAIGRKKINPRWLAVLAQKFHMKMEDLANPTLESILPIKIYISMPRELFSMQDENVDGFYDHLNEVAKVYFKPVQEMYPDRTVFEILRPDLNEDGSHRRNYLGYAVKLVKECDLVWFAPQWEGDYICQIEHKVALQYVKQFMYLNDELGDYCRRLGVTLEESDA